MAVNTQCPKCSFSFDVTEAFPGSRVECSQCGAVLILDFEVEHASRRSLVPPTHPPHVGDIAHRLTTSAIDHLSSWIDVPSADIRKALSLLENGQAYQVWKIPKGDSHLFREITSPNDPLKLIQRRILDRLLYRIPVSNASHGFIPSRSIVTNASYHLKTAQSILNLDLKNAFPSVKTTKVKHIFVRYLKIPLKHLGEVVEHRVLDKAIEILVQLTTHNDGLPQGAPTSGYLLNAACINLDKNIYRVLQQYGPSYRYTRYADDMTISAPNALPEKLLSEIQKIVLNSGFQINPQKVHYSEQGKGQRLEVTGLILARNRVRIPSKRLDNFRAILHQASLIEEEQLTLEKKVEIQSIVAFVKMVYGQLPHRLWVPYKTYLNKHKLPIPRGSIRPQWEQYKE